MDPEADLAFAEFRLDRADERLRGPDGPIKIGHKAWRVLLMLATSEGRLITKDALFETVWDGTIVSESALTSVIKELRRALGDEIHAPRFIEAVYGRGYRFIAPVVTARAGAALESDRPSPPPPPPARRRPPLVLVPAFGSGAIDASHPHCAAALREEILSGLARFREIQLVADSRPEDEARAGRPPPSDRDYQLNATLLPDGEGAKVIARAKRLIDGRIVWAETMSLADTGAAKGVETIVRRIIGSVLPAVDEDIFESLPIESDDFYDRYLIAKRRSLTTKSYAEARAAADALEALIAERPDFGLAYPPLARLYNTDFGYTGLGSTGPAERARALELARAGLAADRRNVHAYTVLGFCHLWHDQRQEARACFDQALAMNPYNPVRLNEVARGMIYLGELEDARSHLESSLLLQTYADDDYFEDSISLCLLEERYSDVPPLATSMRTRTLWADLYLALCDGMTDRAPAGRKLKGWIDFVSERWAGSRAPSPHELERWIAFHHPFAHEFEAEFVKLVRSQIESVAENI